MNTKIAALALALCACGPSVSVYSPPTSDVACETDNGILVLDPVPPGWCDEVQGVEDRIFEAFRSVVPFDERFGSSMARTRGWRVVVVDALSWGDNIMGQTDCDNRVVYVNNNRPATSSLGHELAHAVQLCTPTQPWVLNGSVQDYYHSNWVPIFAALERAKLQK